MIKEVMCTSGTHSKLMKEYWSDEGQVGPHPYSGKPQAWKSCKEWVDFLKFCQTHSGFGGEGLTELVFRKKSSTGVPLFDNFFRGVQKIAAGQANSNGDTLYDHIGVKGTDGWWYQKLQYTENGCAGVSGAVDLGPVIKFQPADHFKTYKTTVYVKRV